MVEDQTAPLSNGPLTRPFRTAADECSDRERIMRKCASWDPLGIGASGTQIAATHSRNRPPALGGIHNSLGCLKNNNTSIVANNDIWAVRHTQTDPRAAHWNGTTWEMLPTGEVNAFAIGKTIGASAESVYLTTDQLHVMQR